MITKILLDLLSVCIVALPLLLTLIWGSPHQRGYFDHDDSIRLPHRSESIHAALLGSLGFVVVIFTVLLIEVLRYKRTGNPTRPMGGRLIPEWIWTSYSTIGVFTFGAACQQMFVTVAKYSVGRLRPHFVDICNPEPLHSIDNQLGFIGSWRCMRGMTENQQVDIYLSFPSAHASFAMYTAVYFILFTHHRGKWQGSSLLRPFAQFSALLGAWYVGLTRIMENYHHGSDVLAGFFIGAGFAAGAFFYLLKPEQFVTKTKRRYVEPTYQPSHMGPGLHQPGVIHQPPVIHQPSVIHQPPVIHQFDQPQVIQQPPVVHDMQMR